MRRGQVIALGMFAALVLLPTAARFAIDRYAQWSTRTFFERAAAVTDTVSLPGGRLRIEGMPVFNSAPYVRGAFVWHARYQVTGVSPHAAEEFVGSWQAYKNGTRAYRVGALVVVIPGEDHAMTGVSRVFVRTSRGTWRESQLNFRDLADGVEPPELTAALTSIGVEDLRTIRRTLGPRDREPSLSCRIDGFSVERAELLVHYQAHAIGAGRLHFRLTPDGEAWQLAGIDDLRAPGSAP